MRTTYLLDRKHTIVEVSDTWDVFAAKNDGAESFSEKILGCPIWDFISGEPVRVWLEFVIASAISHEGKKTYDYRCDSPEIKRYMSMSVSLELSGLLRFDHVVLREEKRNVPFHIEHFSKSSDSEVYELCCSLCKRIYAHPQWIEPEADDSFTELSVVYTVCDDCKALLF